LAFGWLAGIAWFFVVAGSGQTWGQALIDAALVAYFLSAARRRLFPVPLFLIYEFEIAYYLYATLADTSYYWIAFTANRLFELSLIYIIGCSIYRIRALRRRGRGGTATRPGALGFSAA
jgi:hypothetical protein